MIAYHEETEKGMHILKGSRGTATLHCSSDSLPDVRRKFALCMKAVDEIPNTEPLIIRMNTRTIVYPT